MSPLILLAPYVFVVVALLVLYAQATRDLRERHHEKWISLGSPPVFWCWTLEQLAALFLFMGYVLFGRYKELNDPRLSGTMRLIQALTALGLLLLVGILWLQHRADQ